MGFFFGFFGFFFFQTMVTFRQTEISNIVQQRQDFVYMPGFFCFVLFFSVFQQLLAETQKTEKLMRKITFSEIIWPNGWLMAKCKKKKKLSTPQPHLDRG